MLYKTCRDPLLSSRAAKHSHLHSATMPFTLPPLPYPKNALEPHMCEKTLEFHYGELPEQLDPVHRPWLLRRT